MSCLHSCFGFLCVLPLWDFWCRWKNQFVCLFLFLHSLLVIILELKSQICSNSHGISIQLENFYDIFMKYWSILGKSKFQLVPFCLEFLEPTRSSILLYWNLTQAKMVKKQNDKKTIKIKDQFIPQIIHVSYSFPNVIFLFVTFFFSSEIVP